jgi:geranylgeranyl diphosphate synthase, type II
MSSDRFARFVDHFENSLKEYMSHRRAESSGVDPLFDSMGYSLFSGGKRFRPQLCYAMAVALNLHVDQVIPYAMAVECVHTYSLIHDDLPCMDNDDMRRGQPTNHRKFSEDLALLAGDALLTESSIILARSYAAQAGPLIEILSMAAGASGMICGQVIDLGRGRPVNSLEDLIYLHEQKTGQLIAASLSGVAHLAGYKSRDVSELGLMLGLAFQVKDDLLDAHEPDNQSFVAFLGQAGAESYLASLSEKLHKRLNDIDGEATLLAELIKYNIERHQ